MLRINPAAFVDIVDTIGKPHAAVAIVGFYRIDSFASVTALNAFSCYLPAAFIGNGLAILKGQTVIVGQLANRANVNHFDVPLSFSDYIIPCFSGFVKYFFKKIFMNFYTVECIFMQISRATALGARPKKMGLDLPDPFHTAEPFAASVGEVPDLDFVFAAVPFHCLLLAFGAFARALVLVVLLSCHLEFPFRFFLFVL